MILFFARDLLWATRIKSTADALALPCRPVRSLEMLQARLGDSQVKGLIVDLDDPRIALELVRALRDWCSHAATGDAPGADRGRIPIVAFGPHVAVEVFEQARQAGADHILARGAFDRQLPEILKALSARPPYEP